MKKAKVFGVLVVVLTAIRFFVMKAAYGVMAVAVELSEATDLGAYDLYVHNPVNRVILNLLGYDPLLKDRVSFGLLGTFDMYFTELLIGVAVILLAVYGCVFFTKHTVKIKR